MDLYNNHKVLLITDEESLKKENITIESYTKEFDLIVEKAINLKNTIEKEITQINELYEKVDKEVTQTFLEKHEKLTKEENALKEKLQNEVTKVKLLEVKFLIILFSSWASLSNIFIPLFIFSLIFI